MSAPHPAADVCRQVIEEVAAGASVTAITSATGFPISRRTFYRRLEEDRDLRKAFDLARVQRADAFADRCASIVEDMLAGRIDPKRAQVALNHLQWQAEKAHPARYGQRVALEHGEGQPTYLDALKAAQSLIEREKAGASVVPFLKPEPAA